VPVTAVPPSPFAELWRDFRRNRGAMIGARGRRRTRAVRDPRRYDRSRIRRKSSTTDAVLKPPSTARSVATSSSSAPIRFGRDLLSRLIHGTRLSC